MGKYARGKHAVLIDDRSGFKIKYKDARTEWNGFRVYKGDWEPKQPQLDPGKYIEGSGPTVLYKPRPDQDQVPTTVQLGPLYGKWSGQCAANLGLITVQQPADAPSGFQMTSYLNSSGIAIAIVLPIPTEAWQQATTALGSITIDVAESATGFEATSHLGEVAKVIGAAVTMSQMTSTLGSVTLSATEDSPGLYVTGTLGSISISGADAVTMSQMTSTLGTTGLFVNGTEIPPGQAATAHLGSVTVVIPGWGTYLWGTDEWGK
tara:strand:- start:445 stop:1233 length:789 start_codon:yes stop_codon:yes gene_type:complete